jgi:hypothetical protein
MLKASLPAMVLTFVFCMTGAHAQQQEQGQPGTLVSDQSREIQLRLPAPYWEHQTREELMQQSQGGCMAPQVPANMVLLVSHKDALVRLFLTRGKRFQMRDKDDLETYVGGVIRGIQKRLGKQSEVLSKSFDERNGMIVHRCALETPLQGGGGCMAQSSAPSRFQSVRYEVVNYFVRPGGEHATHFQMLCMAPTSVWKGLEEELEFTLSSFRYTGEQAEEFFQPDADPEDVPTAEEGARSTGGSGGGNYTTLLMVGGVILVIWFLLRRKKQAAES